MYYEGESDPCRFYNMEQLFIRITLHWTAKKSVTEVLKGTGCSKHRTGSLQFTVTVWLGLAAGRMQFV